MLSAATGSERASAEARSDQVTSPHPTVAQPLGAISIFRFGAHGTSTGCHPASRFISRATRFASTVAFGFARTRDDHA